MTLGQDSENVLFSVIVPTYNRADTIVETLNSVKEQWYRPIELVVVNDGSVDATSELVAKWAIDNEEANLILKYFEQANQGASAARNRGIAECSGQYVQFLDSDDLIHPERLSKLVKKFSEDDYDYIETGFDGFASERGEILETHRGHIGKDQLELLLLGRLWPNAIRVAYRKSLIDRIGPWNSKMSAFEDYEYAIRALTAFPPPKTASIEDVLASARRDGEHRRSRILKERPGRELRVHCEELLCNAVRGRKDIDKALKSQLASRLYALGFRSNAKGWLDLGRRCVASADSLDPQLDRLGKRRRAVAKAGRVGGTLYELFGTLKRHYLSF